MFDIMKFDEYINRAKVHGHIEDDYGMAWEDAADFIQGSLFNFCCCGDPEENLRYIYEKLVDINHRRDDGYVFKEPSPSDQFLWYWLDSQDFTDHGGIIPGWLNDRGKALMRALEKILNINNESEVSPASP